MSGTPWAWLGALTIVVAAGAPAVAALWPAGRPGGKPEALVLGLLVGWAQFVVLSKICFLAGLWVAGPGLIVVYALHIAICRFWRRIEPPADRANDRTPRPFSPGASILITYCGAVLFVFLIALYPLTSAAGDSLFYWLAKGWIFAVSGDVHLFPFTHGATYPLAVPFGHLTFLLLNNSVGVALWQHLFLFGVLFYVLLILYRRFSMAGLAIGAAFLVPQLMMEPFLGKGLLLYADTTLAAALLLSCVLISERWEGGGPPVWTASVALTFFVLTKVNAALYLVIIVAAVCLAVTTAPGAKGNRRGRLMSWGKVFAAPAGALIAWNLALLLTGSTDGISQKGLGVLGEEIFGSSAPFEALFHRLWLSVGYFLSFTSLGDPLSLDFFRKLGWIFPAALMGLGAWPRLQGRERFLLLGSFGVLLSIVLLTYVLIPAEDDSRAYWWFRTGYGRAIIHVVPCMVFSVQLLMGRAAHGLFGADRLEAPAARSWIPSGRVGRWWFAVGVLIAPMLVSGLFRPDLPRHRTESVLTTYLPTPSPKFTPDPFGLYDTEDWGGLAVRWTSDTVRMKVWVQSPTLRVRYWISHPEVTEEIPVAVAISVSGAAPIETRHTRGGLYELVFDLSGWARPLIDFDLEVSPTWLAPGDRPLGVALYDFEWD